MFNIGIKYKNVKNVKIYFYSLHILPYIPDIANVNFRIYSPAIVAGLLTGCVALEANCAGQKVKCVGNCARLYNFEPNKIFDLPTPYQSKH